MDVYATAPTALRGYFQYVLNHPLSKCLLPSSGVGGMVAADSKVQLAAVEVCAETGVVCHRSRKVSPHAPELRETPLFNRFE